jgi:6-phosphogluconate dehydrogenase
MSDADIGIVGLAVMGQNLALNLEDKGYSVAVYNRTAERTKAFIDRHPDKRLVPAESLETFVGSLLRPRRILLMVKAGPSTDAVLERLFPLLEKGDVVMDGGNAHYKETDARFEKAESCGLLYLGMGISGGESGALNGPSIMAGGHREAFDIVEDLLQKTAAQEPEGPCCAYFGPRSAGHYVKMVHNGIEYAIMETIAEAYDLMQRGLGMPPGEAAAVFGEWNHRELASYLFEITEKILRTSDPKSGRPLIDCILDTAKQKGTGKWSTQSALDLGTPSSSIAAAVFARILSSLKEERTHAATVLSGPTSRSGKNRTTFLKDLYGAVYLSVICAYAQGLRQLRDASREHDYALDLSEAARVWMAGCIIRAKLLVPIRKALIEHPDLPFLFLVEPFSSTWETCQENLRRTICTAHEWGIPVPGLSAVLNFLDGYRASRLPANLLQAQRDFFGAHTYQRGDREGVYHTDWEAS